MKPRLIVEQKITPLVNRYAVYEVDSSGNKGKLLALAQQKRVALKERIRFYEDEKRTKEIFSFGAEKVLDVHGKYFVQDAAGKEIGIFTKDFKKSLFASTWHILKNDKKLLSISEKSQHLAYIRRFGGFIPVIGELIDIISGFFRYHFNITDSSSGKVVGLYRKTTRLRDHYELSLDDASFKKTDWRILACLAVALDALQSR